MRQFLQNQELTYLSWWEVWYTPLRPCLSPVQLEFGSDVFLFASYSSSQVGRAFFLVYTKLFFNKSYSSSLVFTNYFRQCKHMLIQKKMQDLLCELQLQVLVTIATFTATVLFLLTVLKYCHWILEIKHSHCKLQILRQSYVRNYMFDYDQFLLFSTS